MAEEYKVDEEEVELLSSVEELKKFSENNLCWRDMKGRVELWLEGIKTSLINPDLAKDMDCVADFQGKAKMCVEFLNLPDVLIGELEEPNILKKKGEQDG